MKVSILSATAIVAVIIVGLAGLRGASDTDHAFHVEERLLSRQFSDGSFFGRHSRSSSSTGVWLVGRLMSSWCS